MQQFHWAIYAYQHKCRLLDTRSQVVHRPVSNMSQIWVRCRYVLVINADPAFSLHQFLQSYQVFCRLFLSQQSIMKLFPQCFIILINLLRHQVSDLYLYQIVSECITVIAYAPHNFKSNCICEFFRNKLQNKFYYVNLPYGDDYTININVTYVNVYVIVKLTQGGLTSSIVKSKSKHHIVYLPTQASTQTPYSRYLC